MFKHRINLYKDENLLDEIIIEGCTRHQAMLASDLNNMKIVSESTIINEKVYKDEIFTDLYSQLLKHDRHMFTTQELSEYFPLKNRVHKKLKAHSSDMNKLYVSICSFDLDGLFFEMKHWSKGKIENELMIQKLEEIKQTITKNTNGFFITFGKNHLFGIMFLNKNKLSLNTLKHEFIHYYTWMNGDVSDIYSADENLYSEEFVLLNLYFNVTPREFRYLTRDKEYETLLNDFLNVLKKIKNEYFYDLSDKKFADKITDDLLKDWSFDKISSNNAYLKKLSGLYYIDDLRFESSFIMIVIYNLLDEKLWNIKNHIYGAFNNK